MCHSFSGLPCWVEIDYRLEGRFFNLSHLNTITKVTKTAVIDLQYADDSAIFAHIAEELQTSIDLLTEAYQNLRLSINIRKTKIIYQSSLGNFEGPRVIKISGTTLEVVEHFPYLESHPSQKATTKPEIQYRICSASTSFRKLRNQGFDNHNLRKDTKVMVYKDVCITTLLYGSEAWGRSANVVSEIYFVSNGKITASMPVSSWRPTQLVSRQ